MKETPLEDNQTAKAVKGGYQLKVTTVLREELVFWILSMANHVKVLAPEIVRKRVAGDLRKASALYR
jgi:predicted DNA-binding transcriptional regulator YafY